MHKWLQWTVYELKRGKLSYTRAIREIKKEKNVTVYKQGKKSLNVIIKYIILHGITSIRTRTDFPIAKENALGNYKVKNIYIRYINRYTLCDSRECAYIFKSIYKSLCFFLAVVGKVTPSSFSTNVSLCAKYSFFDHKLIKTESNELKKSTSLLSLQWLWCRLMMIV